MFLVRSKKTQTIFALKVLRKDNIIKRNQVEHTKTERNVLGVLRHPFIVGLNCAFQTKDKLYFVLDYCAGGELFFHLGKVRVRRSWGCRGLRGSDGPRRAERGGLAT